MARIPTRNPNTPRVATTSVSTLGARRRARTGAAPAAAPSTMTSVPAALPSTRSVAAVTASLEAVEDVDDRRPQDDDEQRGEDAEHHGQQHLDRCLLGLLLGQLDRKST